jgi:hypothetical protein
MVQVLNNRSATLVVYLLVNTGSASLVVKLSAIEADELVVLAQPYLDNSPPRLSLIQQRRIDATLAVPPLPNRGRTWVAALGESPTAPAILAAGLDVAEKENVEATPAVASQTDSAVNADSQPSSIATRETKRRIARSISGHAAVATRDIFNRSFGVFTVAAN